MLLLTASMAFAGWTLSAEENGCKFFIGDRRGAYAPVRAECAWPIPADKLQRLLAINNDHDDYFSSVVESRVVGPAPGGELVYQHHEASGISDREVMLVMNKEPIAGGMRYTWTRASDQSRVTGQHVLTVEDTGKWEIVADGTGSRVVYELLYDPGGSVPSFLVRWFQGAGLRTLVGEMRAWAETH